MCPPIIPPIITVNYGTGDGYDVSVRPSTIPDSSDTVLVNLMGYNDRGEAFAAIDPAGIESRTLFDDLGRKVCVIANYQDEPNTPDQNNTIAYSYNADGQLLTLTAVNPDTDDQVTRYVYGTTLAESGVARADLLRAEIYPDSDDTAPDLGDGADGVYDRIEYTYNRTGQVVTKTDQNGTVHAYSYDGLGRRVQDSVTAVGSGIDNAVRSISTSYEVRGLVASLTSYSTPQADSGSIANQVELQYNAFGLLVADYQSHAGAVNVSTTSKVQYTYADGSANTVRRTQVVYPNGRALDYQFNSGTDDALSRVSFLADDSSGSPGQHLAEYGYLGANRIVRVDYPQPQLGTDLADPAVYGNDKYTARLDAFDRVVDLAWCGLSLPFADVERIRYGYDRVGNRLFRQNAVAPAGFDELYAYDGLRRLVDFDRGTLNESRTALTSLGFRQQWQLDATGNWSGFDQFDQADATQSLSQTRQHNPVNEITGVTAVIGSAWAACAFDLAGNMTALPKPSSPGSALGCVYDAWNRLVQVTDPSSPGVTVSYQYDGRNYQTVRSSTSAGTTDTRHYYYSDQWQVLQQSAVDGAPAQRQFVWGLRYVDDLVLRDRDTTGNGTLDERLFALQDANWNVTAISGASGSIAERYQYSAYGTMTSLSGAFVLRAASLYDAEALYCGYLGGIILGVYLARRRRLWPHLGFWDSRDPIVYRAGDSSLYRYVVTSPTNHIDPFGLNGESDALGQMWCNLLWAFGIGGISGPTSPPSISGPSSIGPPPPPQLWPHYSSNRMDQWFYQQAGGKPQDTSPPPGGRTAGDQLGINQNVQSNAPSPYPVPCGGAD